MSPFDFINSINKKTLIDWNEQVEKDYTPFIINRGLGYFTDCVLSANEMNINSHLDKKLQYDFLFHIIKKGKRFEKWIKPQNDDTVELIMEVYNYSQKYASSIVDMFSEEDINNLKTRIDRGGRK